jgi:Ankyrin repeats (many copies)
MKKKTILITSLLVIQSSILSSPDAGTVVPDISTPAIPRKDTSTSPYDQKLLNAIPSGDIKAVQRALDLGASVNSKDASGQTGLHLAVLYNRSDIADLLLKEGADPSIEDGRGKVPTQLATDFKRRTGVAKVIEEHKITLFNEARKSNPSSDTLIKAINNNYADIVTLLLKKGIKPTQEDIDLAEERKYETLKQVLEKAKPKETPAQLAPVEVPVTSPEDTDKKNKPEQPEQPASEVPVTSPVDSDKKDKPELTQESPPAKIEVA